MHISSPHTPGASIHDWFSKSGFTPITYETKNWAYAERLARYISDPSTIRARTLEQYGRAPTIDAIREMRAKWLEKVRSRKEVGYKSARKNDPKAMKEVPPEPANDEPPAEVVLALALAEPDDQPAVEIVALPGLRYSTMLTPNDVIEACSTAMGIPSDEIVGAARFKPIMEARMLAAAILRARGNSYPNIGRRIGGRDHTTALSAVRRFFAVLEDRPKMLAAWLKLAPCSAKFCRSLAEVELVCVSARR